MDKEYSLEEMIEALIHYYEAAGFTDIYHNELKGKNEEEIKKIFLEVMDASKPDEK